MSKVLDNLQNESMHDQSRNLAINQFVKSYCKEDSFNIIPLDGDAGMRNYYRLKFTKHSHSLILMDCPNSYCSMKPFIDMANYLRSHGFNAPDIIHFDTKDGFLLLEDFGNITLKDYLIGLKKDDYQYRQTYFQIIDLLIDIQQKKPLQNLSIYTNNVLLKELDLYIDYYIPYQFKRQWSDDEKINFKNQWHEIFNERRPSFERTTVLRDFHVENLMYLKTKPGNNKFGLLDFQDASLGSPIYDLVSLLEDARIEVSRDLALECIEYYAKSTGLAKDQIILEYHILGAQRNMRILGVFARKMIRDGQNQYLQYIPRVQKYLEYDLDIVG